MTTMDLVYVAALILAAMATVMAFRLLWAVIGLAVVSAVVTILLFRFGAPIAGVFELSVCAGLIPAIFISTISLTRRLTPEAMTERRKEKLKRFIPLLVVLIIAAVLLSQVHLVLNFPTPPASAEKPDVQTVLWWLRQVDLVGQIVILMGGAYAVRVLFKEFKREH